MKGSTAVGEVLGWQCCKSNTPAPSEGPETLSSYRNALQQPQPSQRSKGPNLTSDKHMPGQVCMLSCWNLHSHKMDM